MTIMSHDPAAVIREPKTFHAADEETARAAVKLLEDQNPGFAALLDAHDGLNRQMFETYLMLDDDRKRQFEEHLAKLGAEQGLPVRRVTVEVPDGL